MYCFDSPSKTANYKFPIEWPERYMGETKQLEEVMEEEENWVYYKWAAITFREGEPSPDQPTAASIIAEKVVL